MSDLEQDTHPQDSPTHRIHLMQMTMQQIKTHTELLQARRARIAEKITKAKSNSAIARNLTVNKQFKKLITKMEKILINTENDLNDLADDMNKARALILEMSDGDVVWNREEKTNGTP